MLYLVEFRRILCLYAWCDSCKTIAKCWLMSQFNDDGKYPGPVQRLIKSFQKFKLHLSCNMSITLTEFDERIGEQMSKRNHKLKFESENNAL